MENSKTFIEEEDKKEFLEHFEKIMVLCNKQVEYIDFLENIIKKISDYSLEGIIKFAENDKKIGNFLEEALYNDSISKEELINTLYLISKERVGIMDYKFIINIKEEIDNKIIELGLI